MLKKINNIFLIVFIFVNNIYCSKEDNKYKFLQEWNKLFNMEIDKRIIDKQTESILIKYSTGLFCSCLLLKRIMPNFKNKPRFSGPNFIINTIAFISLGRILNFEYDTYCENKELGNKLIKHMTCCAMKAKNLSLNAINWIANQHNPDSNK